MKKSSAGELLFAFPMVFFLCLPLGALVLSISRRESFQLFHDPDSVSAIFVSLKSCTLTLLILIIFGTPLAYYIAKSSAAIGGLLSSLVDIPAAMPPVVSGLGLLVAFGRDSWLGGFLARHGIIVPLSFWAVVLSQTFVASSFYLRPLIDGFRQFDPLILQTAEMDGANQFRKITQIVLPAMAPVFFGAISLGGCRALGEFGATILFAGSFPKITETIPIHIYGIFGDQLQTAIALGGWMIVIVGILSFLSRWILESTFRPSS